MSVVVICVVKVDVIDLVVVFVVVVFVLFGLATSTWCFGFLLNFGEKDLDFF